MGFIRIELITFDPFFTGQRFDWKTRKGRRKFTGDAMWYCQ